MKTGTLTTLLTIVFVVLKLSHVIDWSWWLVLLPAIIFTGIIITLTSIIGFVTLFEEEKRKQG